MTDQVLDQDSGDQGVTIRISQERAQNKGSSKDREVTVNTRQEYFVDHAISRYIIENGFVLLIAKLKLAITPKPILDTTNSKNFAKNVASFTIGGTFIVESIQIIQRVLVKHVYSHIPYFSEVENDNKKIRNWLTTNLPVALLNAMWNSFWLLRVVNSSRSKNEGLNYINLKSSSFRPWRFILKLVLTRFFLDIYFYILHYIIHTKYFYSWIHKRHHQEKRVRLSSNYHFTILDLLLEGSIPMRLAMRSVLGLGIKMSVWEETLISTYIEWQEIASHSGKPIRTSSLIAPLSIIYNYFWDIDSDMVLHHAAHHRVLKGNYGISPWLDNIIGTNINRRFTSMTEQEKLKSNQ